MSMLEDVSVLLALQLSQKQLRDSDDSPGQEDQLIAQGVLVEPVDERICDGAPGGRG
jgi:hypothetical protein